MKLFHLMLLVTVCAPLIFAAAVRSAEPTGNAANGSDTFADKIKLGERFLFFNTVALYARKGPGALISTQLRDFSETHPRRDAIVKFLTDHFVDWNEAARFGNGCYDRFVLAYSVAEQRQQKIAVAKVADENNSIVESELNLHQFLMALCAESPRQALGRQIGAYLARTMCRSLEVYSNPCRTLSFRIGLTEVMLALTRYRSEHNQYPEKLDVLVPKYIAAIPDDMFAGKPTPIRYRREGDAYALWTVFLNGIDDDGRTAEDDPAGDDYVLRPVPKVKAKQN